MIIRIDQASPDPVYLQIRDQIVAAIAHGELAAADRLPSVRALASDLGVNLHTVNKAYATLRDEGFLIMRGRAGAVVADFQNAATPERMAASTEKLRGALLQLALEHRAQGGTRRSFLDMAQEQADRAFSLAGEERCDANMALAEHSNSLQKPHDDEPDAASPSVAAKGA